MRLGVNIDHVATLRQARGGVNPSPLEAAFIVTRAGADGITIHLREDRRHIQDNDLFEIRKNVPNWLNLEMAATDEMVGIAQKCRPDAVCLVPEKRAELTTEGGLDVRGQEKHLKKVVEELKKAGIQVSLFIEPDREQILSSARIGADAVELHTGRYANLPLHARRDELGRLREAAELAFSKGLIVHAGHGLDYHNVGPVAAIPEIEELNIGHSIVARAVFVGLEEAVREMKTIILRNSRKNFPQNKEGRKEEK